MSRKRVGVIGASGFIGQRLCVVLEEEGWEVVRISRSERNVDGQIWRLLDDDCLDGLSALVNLAGERVDQRWTDESKKRIRDSRVGLTRKISEWIERLPEGEGLEVWLNASGVGVYGNRGDEVLTEDSSVGCDYLANLCEDWEGAAKGNGLEGVRVVFPRVGVVFGEGGDAWKKMRRVFMWGVGGKLGNGKQWFPWIHIEDLVRGFVFCLKCEELKGGVNMVAPGIVRNSEFTNVLAGKLCRPALMIVPGVMLRILLGGFGVALLSSQRVFPGRLKETGFEFLYGELSEALDNLLGRGFR